MSDELAAEFEPVSAADWADRIHSTRGDSPLVTPLEDGLSVAWLYTPADALASDPGVTPGADPYVRGIRVGEPWAIRQENGAPARGEANAQILEDLEGGATEVLLRIESDGIGGVPARSVDELNETLDGVYLDLAPIALEAGSAAPSLGRALCDLWSARGVNRSEVRGSIGIDPLGTLARIGASQDAFAAPLAAAAGQLAEIQDGFPGVQVLAVDTVPYADAGAGAVFELALAIGSAVAYLRAGEHACLSPEDVARGLEFRLTVGPDQFLEIAKLRTIRRLWSSVLESCGVPPEQRRSRTYAKTSRRMLSSLDPWVNLLRITSAAFAAGVGGADGVTALPFDEAVGEAFGQPGALGRRLARNTQLVLLEESFLSRVADPSGGSWYVESLTDQLAQRAWEEFQTMERTGGIEAAIASGRLAARLAADTARRQHELSARKRILTGVNAFPLLGDDGLKRSPPDGRGPWGAPAAPGRALTPQRDAAQFEHLRARATALAAAQAAEPSIMLACMGPMSSYIEISQWAKSFFEAGGIRTIPSTGGSDGAHRVLLTEHGLSAVAVCPGRGVQSKDQTELITALRGAGAGTIYLVGADQETAQAFGADSGVWEGVPMVTVLSDLLDRLAAITAAGTKAVS
jgi:methylmalonyl-CoA mutase